jgi:hypothetical protein
MAEVLARVVAAFDSVDDPWQDPGWLEMARHAREKLEPMVADSSVAVAVYSGSVDPQMALQTGYMILLDKPIVALVTPGVKAPRKLMGVADEIIEGSPDDPTLGPRMIEAMNRITAREKTQAEGDDAS